MSNLSTTPPPPFDDPDEDAAYCRAINLRMMQVGANIIDELDQAKTREDIPLEQRADTYERITRSLRRAILLAERLAGQPSVTPEEHATRLTRAREKIQRDVEDAIVRAGPDPASAETLRLELLERLEDPELEFDILTRPLAEISTEFRRDLGLADQPHLRSFRRRTPADIAELRANAARRPPRAPPTSLPFIQPDRNHRRALVSLKEN